jgi:hypothetical protein
MRQSLFAILAVFVILPSVAESRVEDERSLLFSVHLDGSRIGYHRFELLPDEQGVDVVSEAEFDVDFLFFNAFTYRHLNRESWDGQCLETIDAETRENDKQFSVVGRRVDDRFVIETDGDAQTLQSCVMTFAYWNPEFLDQSKLLNPQSGEYLPVEVEALGEREIIARGQTVTATAYRVTAKDRELTVYYSDKGKWVGLESVARNGKIIRYELS